MIFLYKFLLINIYYMLSLRSIIHTLPMVARGGMLAHSPSLHLGFASTSLLRPRSLWSHGLLSGVANAPI